MINHYINIFDIVFLYRKKIFVYINGENLRYLFFMLFKSFLFFYKSTADCSLLAKVVTLKGFWKLDLLLNVPFLRSQLRLCQKILQVLKIR